MVRRPAGGEHLLDTLQQHSVDTGVQRMRVSCGYIPKSTGNKLLKRERVAVARGSSLRQAGFVYLWW